MKEERKHIYGAYLNMARQNAFIVLRHISRQFGSDTGNEDSLSQMKAIQILQSGNAEEKEHAINLLRKHFPILQPMVDNYLTNPNIKDKTITPTVYYNMLSDIFQVLNMLRNENSHYRFKDNRVTDVEFSAYNKRLSYSFKKAFDAARRIVKERFELQDYQLNFITKNIRKRTQKRDRRTGEVVKDRRGRPQTVYLEDERFFYKLDDSDNQLSAKGVAFLTCLFLEKKYITEFLDSSGLYFFPRGARIEEKRIIREIFSVYRIRMPRTRIDSTRPDYALGMDILNELKKSPDELYQTLSPADQARFRISPEGDDENDAMGNKLLMKRFANRFPYFALRYIDDSKAFRNIRFQVSLGRYRYRFYHKKGVDSKTANRVRVLQKPLNGFGRLNEIEEERISKWGSLIRPVRDMGEDSPESKPYIRNQRAGYLINGNKIGLAFNCSDTRYLRKGIYMPNIEESPCSEDYRAREVINKQPLCWLSTHELPAMIFHHFLSKESSNSSHIPTEDVIIEYVAQYNNLFRAIKDGPLTPASKQEIERELKERYNIELRAIPVKLQNYLLGRELDVKKRNRERSKARIERMIEWTDNRLSSFRRDKSRVGSRDNRLGRRDYVVIRTGRLAAFLVKDIVGLQPAAPADGEGRPAGWNKPTGMNYQIIQSSLAVYDKPVEELKSLFNNAGLTSGEYQHPFLADVLSENPANTIRFYELYLERRLRYLDECRRERDYESYPFLSNSGSRERNEAYYKKLADHLLNNQPVELPRGLFTESIKEILRSDYGGNSGIVEALSQERCNVTYLIAQYFEHCSGDRAQSFYDFKRSYSIFDRLEGEIVNRNQLKKQYYTNQELVELSKSGVLNKRIDDFAQQSAEEQFGTRKYSVKDRSKETFFLQANAVKEFSASDFSDSKEMSALYKKLIERLTQRRFIDNNDLKNLIIYWEKKTTLRGLAAMSREYKRNEKQIRQCKVQDMLLFMMAKEILISDDLRRDDIEGFKLEHIDPQGETNILSVQIPFHVELTLPDGTTKTISQERLKVKNYGDFFTFLYDERIKTLLPLIESEEIDRETLERELGYYDTNRVEIFRLAFNYEKMVLNSREVEAKREGSPSFSEIVRASDFPVNTIDKRKITLIRNAFGHNHYDLKGIVDVEEIPNMAKSMVEKMTKLTEREPTPS